MMKKLTAILLALAMLLSLTGCEEAISKLLYQRDKDDPDAVQAQEPDIPNTSPSGGDAAPTEPVNPSPSGDAAPVEPEAPEPEEGASGESGEKTDVTVRVSHEDVTLFSAGETFRLTVWDSNGKDPDACVYTSADPAVAAVDEAGGEVTAVAPGITTVTVQASYGDKTWEFDCIVRCRWEAEDPGLPDGGGEDAAPETPSQPGDTPQTPAASTSLSDFFSTLQGQYEGMGMMMALDGELLENYYPGLSGIAAVEEVLIQETATTIANVAVGLVRLSDSAPADDILAVQAVFQSRINTQAEGGAWYPASCETWENGVITSASNYVGMFVYPDGAHEMANLFTDTFGD